MNEFQIALMDISQFIIQCNIAILLILVILNFKIIFGISKNNFECPECGWKGVIKSQKGCELIGTYCPRCSDQR